MKYKMSDVLNFIGNVVYIQYTDSAILYPVNEWLNEFGNIKVEVDGVHQHHNGTKTIFIK